MNTIAEKLAEVQQCFKSKLLAGEFKVSKVDTYTTIVVIDGVKFFIWTGNINIPSTVELYKDAPNPVYFELTADEAKTLHGKMQPMLKSIEAQTAKAEIAELEKKIQTLKLKINE